MRPLTFAVLILLLAKTNVVHAQKRSYENPKTQLKAHTECITKRMAYYY